jgi:hypothetical protein
MNQQVYINLPAESFGDLAELFRQLGEKYPQARDIHLEDTIPGGIKNGIRVIWTKEVS